MTISFQFYFHIVICKELLNKIVSNSLSSKFEDYWILNGLYWFYFHVKKIDVCGKWGFFFFLVFLMTCLNYSVKGYGKILSQTKKLTCTVKSKRLSNQNTINRSYCIWKYVAYRDRQKKKMVGWDLGLPAEIN